MLIDSSGDGKMEQKRWVLRLRFTNSKEVRNFLKEYPRVEMKRGVLGVYPRHFASLEKFLVIVSGHCATDQDLLILAKEIKRKYPNVKTEVVLFVPTPPFSIFRAHKINNETGSRCGLEKGPEP